MAKWLSYKISNDNILTYLDLNILEKYKFVFLSIDILLSYLIIFNYPRNQPFNQGNYII